MKSKQGAWRKEGETKNYKETLEHVGARREVVRAYWDTSYGSLQQVPLHFLTP